MATLHESKGLAIKSARAAAHHRELEAERIQVEASGYCWACMEARATCTAPNGHRVCAGCKRQGAGAVQS